MKNINLPKTSINSRSTKVTLLLVGIAVWVVSVIAVARYLGKLPSAITIPGQSEKQTTKIVSEESDIISVVKKVSPSVVSIAVGNQQTLNFFGMPIGSPDQESGIGTGFVVSADGLIITNKHVVSRDNQKYIAIIKANDGSEKKYDITQVNRDPFNDLAIVKIDATGLTPVELGDSGNLQVGHWDNLKTR